MQITPPVSFLLLPIEIRQQIYRLCLIDPDPIHIEALPPRLHSPAPTGFADPEVDKERVRLVSQATIFGRDNYINTSLLRTCRIIYQEAIPILYGSNAFQFLFKRCWDTLSIFEKRLTALSRQCVRKIEISFPNIEPGGGRSEFSAASRAGLGLLKGVSNLRVLTFRLCEDVMTRDVELFDEIQHAILDACVVKVDFGPTHSYDEQRGYALRKVRASDTAIQMMNKQEWEVSGFWETVGRGHEFACEDKWMEYLEQSRLAEERDRARQQQSEDGEEDYPSWYY
ncbi:MAG: hypothetical protein Q9213_003479 [Squamulea squamosa]